MIRIRFAAGLALAAALAVAGCAERNLAYGPVAAIDSATGYYPGTRVDTSDDALMILTMSGGGKRAAAFSQGMLDGLAAIPFEGGTLLDEVDIVSSVSGGSVTAANFVVNGPGSFGAYRRDFLHVDFMPRLYRDVLLKPPLPWSLLVENNRIEPVVGMVEDAVVAPEVTFADIPASRPYWILNATDIGSLQTFPFTQYQFDIICADVGRYPVARAVAASAGYPVALSSISVENSAPCTAQRAAGGRLAPDMRYLTVFEPRQGFHTGVDSYRLERFQTALEKLEPCESGAGCPRPNYIHLYDGGIADNLGLSEPLWLLTDAIARWNPMMDWAANGRLRRITLVTANAGSAPDHEIGMTTATPDMITTLRRVIGAAIDRRSIGLTAQASLLPEDIIGADPEDPPTVAVAALSFPRIADAACRRAFGNLPTDWGLEPHEVSATIGMGAAMTFASQPFRDHAGVVGGSVAEREWDRMQACLMESACACISNPAQCSAQTCGSIPAM